TLRSIKSRSAVLERAVAQRLCQIEIGELPLLDEMECGNAIPPHPGPIPQGREGNAIRRHLLKSRGLDVRKVLAEIGRNRREKVVPNAFEDGVVVARALFLFGARQSTKPRLALSDCPPVA